MILTPDQVRIARKLLGWSMCDVASRVDVSEAAVGRYEGGETECSVLNLDVLRGEFEAAGLVFTSGPAPGVRTQAYVTALRAANDKLRAKVDRLLAPTDDLMRRALRRIVIDQALAPRDDQVETLEC